MNKSSNCEESLPLKIVKPCSKVFTKDVFFCAVHKVFYIAVRPHQGVPVVQRGEV